MINQLKLANKTFPNNLVLAPLAGFSSVPFRLLAWRYSQPAFCCTEMISCKALMQKSFVSQLRYIKKDPSEGPVSYQLFGNDPNDLAHATKMMTDFGADLIDLNCGCPVRKVRSQGAGSSLLTNPSLLYQLILAMKQNTHLPVSVKIRVEANSPDKFNAEIAKVVGDAGADFIVVHGRHWHEHYDKPCHYDQIQFFAETMKIPVIGNGDVACIDSLKRMLATGCAGAMIGRAAIGQPWLVKKLIAEMNQESYTSPTLAEIGATFLEHIFMLEKLMQSEKFAVLYARKLSRHYAHGMQSRKEFCIAVNSCESLKKLIAICEQYFINWG
jgi:tRNA-dihydrouridine synthase B